MMQGVCRYEIMVYSFVYFRFLIKYYYDGYYGIDVYL